MEPTIEELKAEIARLKAVRSYPGNAEEMRQLVETVPAENLGWLYQSGELIRTMVNERWGK
jgi:phage gp37-like protein